MNAKKGFEEVMNMKKKQVKEEVKEEKKLSTMDLLRGAKDLAPVIKEYVPLFKEIVGGIMDKRTENKTREQAEGTPFSVQCFAAGNGGSICLTIPKNLVDALQINSGDILDLLLRKIVRR